VTDSYAKIVQNNITRLFNPMPKDLAENLPADKSKNDFVFTAFGETCEVGPGGIFLNKKKQTSVQGILISLYALHAVPTPLVQEPFKAFREFPGSMPYTGAFATHAQQILVPHASQIKALKNQLCRQLCGHNAPKTIGGDFAFIVHPLPKIALCYILYLADDEFPASVTCLFSNNAHCFLPTDALADVGEYTSRKIIDIIRPT
jgi:hypothetical protein